MLCERRDRRGKGHRMHLTPRERERLLLHSGAELARRRLARGARLGAPEAIALVCDEVCELAWDDVPYAEVVERARQVTVLVHVDAPFGASPPEGPGAVHPADGDIELAPGRERRTAVLRNTGTLPVWVSSHVPLDRLNPALRVELDAPGRYRLDLPAGTAVRVEPAGEREVAVVRLEGALPPSGGSEGAARRRGGHR
jgi:urease subunit gamma/beta